MIYYFYKIALYNLININVINFIIDIKYNFINTHSGASAVSF